MFPSGWTWDGHSSNFVGGGFAGYNLAIAQGFFLGVEADIDASNKSVTKFMDHAGAPDPAWLQEWNSAWQASLRGRVGYTFHHTMVYVTGGAAWTDFDMKVYPINLSTNPNSFSKTLQGWTLGGGLEHELTDHLAVRLEYRHSDFGKVSLVPSVAGYSNAFSEIYRVKQDTVRVGIVYRFGHLTQ